MNNDYLIINKCNHCTSIQYKIGLCYEHYTPNKYNDIIKQINNSDTDKLHNIKQEINNKIKKLGKHKSKIKRELNNMKISNQILYKSIIKKQFPFLENYEYKSLNYDDIINFVNYLNTRDLYKIFLKDINCVEDVLNKPIEELNKNNARVILKYLYNKDKILNMQTNILTLYERRIYKYKLKYLKKIIYNKNNIIVTPNKCKLNSYILFNKLLEKNINDLILILPEYRIRVSYETYFYDIYIMIRTKRQMFVEAFIEIDEKCHYTNNVEYNKRDIIKDIYCFNNCISLLRICTDTISEPIITQVIEFINKISEKGDIIYNINDKYIEHKNKMILTIMNDSSEKNDYMIDPDYELEYDEFDDLSSNNSDASDTSDTSDDNDDNNKQDEIL